MAFGPDSMRETNALSNLVQNSALQALGRGCSLSSRYVQGLAEGQASELGGSLAVDGDQGDTPTFHMHVLRVKDKGRCLHIKQSPSTLWVGVCFRAGSGGKPVQLPCALAYSVDKRRRLHVKEGGFNMVGMGMVSRVEFSHLQGKPLQLLPTLTSASFVVFQWGTILSIALEVAFKSSISVYHFP